MASDFFYFISSLPALNFSEKPPFSYEAFLQYAATLLSKDEVKLLASLKLYKAELPKDSPQVVKAWQEEEVYLRNELSVLRARKLRKDAEKWKKESDLFSSWQQKRLEEIMALPDAWEKEKALNFLRWQKLDDLQAGHYFDLRALIIYALKLQIIEKQNTLDEEKGKAVAAEIIEENLKQAAKLREVID